MSKFLHDDDARAMTIHVPRRFLRKQPSQKYQNFLSESFSFWRRNFLFIWIGVFSECFSLKPMLWELKRRVSPRHFYWVPTWPWCMFLWRNKKNIQCPIPGLWNFQILLLLHRQVNGQNPLVQPRCTCLKTDIFLISWRKHMLWVLIIRKIYILFDLITALCT